MITKQLLSKGKLNKFIPETKPKYIDHLALVHSIAVIQSLETCQLHTVLVISNTALESLVFQNWGFKRFRNSIFKGNSS